MAAAFSDNRTVLDRALGVALLGASTFIAPAALAEDGAPVTLGPLKVEGASPNALTHGTGLSRSPDPIQKIPQTINVIPKEVLQQRNAVTLDDALRNVAGITAGVGEGGGSFNGDQFRIRGFDAKDDIYVDGLRDFGVYTRDAFNVEEVQVLKGPSSDLFGRGTTGGGINTISKSPRLRQFFDASGSIGSGNYYRGTVDANIPFSSTAAIRFNGMIHYQDIVDRNIATADRYGFAPSLALGIGTDTNFTLIWQHQKDNRIPDYGVPVLAGAPGYLISAPVTENAGVPRQTFYGFTRDYDRAEVDMVTAKFSHTVSDWLTLSNDTRFETEDRKFSATRVSCATGLPTGTPAGTPPLPGSCLANLTDGNPATQPIFAVGGAASATGPYEMRAWGLQDIASAVIESHLFGLRNRIITGFDYSYQRNDRNFFDYSPARPNRDPFDPDPDFAYGIVPLTTPTSLRETLAFGTDYGAFLSEQIWLTPAWSIAAGLRFDSYTIDFQETQVNGLQIPTRTSADLLNPKASLIYQPTETQNYYFSYAKSATPQGTSITNLPTPVSQATSAGGFDTRDLEPEESEIFELGAKIGFFDNRLGINAALFRVTKNNAKETDGLGNIVSSGDTQRVQGFELAATGDVLPHLALTANYTFLDTETLSSFTGTPAVPNTAAIGRRIANAPQNAFSVFASYELVERLNFGLGASYRDAITLNNTETSIVPYTFSLDAYAAYQIEHVRFQINLSNLTDRLNYSGTTGGRVVPAPGRAVVFTTTVSF